jgi:hypothetical protein
LPFWRSKESISGNVKAQPNTSFLTVALGDCRDNYLKELTGFFDMFFFLEKFAFF